MKKQRAGRKTWALVSCREFCRAALRRGTNWGERVNHLHVLEYRTKPTVVCKKHVRDVVVVRRIALTVEQVIRLQLIVRIQLSGHDEVAGIVANERPLTGEVAEVRIGPAPAHAIASAWPVQGGIAAAREGDAVLLEAVDQRV